MSSGQEGLFWPLNVNPVSCSHHDQITSSTLPEKTELQEQMGPRYPDKTRWDKLHQTPPASATPHYHPMHAASITPKTE